MFLESGAGRASLRHLHAMTECLASHFIPLLALSTVFFALAGGWSWLHSEGRNGKWLSTLVVQPSTGVLRCHKLCAQPQRVVDILSQL
jgi:hypothetical protein